VINKAFATTNPTMLLARKNNFANLQIVELHAKEFSKYMQAVRKTGKKINSYEHRSTSMKPIFQKPLAKQKSQPLPTKI
jgi:hypothetical protein